MSCTYTLPSRIIGTLYKMEPYSIDIAHSTRTFLLDLHSRRGDQTPVSSVFKMTLIMDDEWTCATSYLYLREAVQDNFFFF